ncbi:MAG TPA: GAF domain-containing protein [Thermoflexus sp.]|nr:GAF domain-containing protein [Thermoflexus sp.]
MGQHIQETIAELIRLMEHLDSVDPSAISEEILRTLLKMVGGTTGWITRLEDEATGSFRVVAAVGSPEALEAEERTHLRWSPCRCQRMLQEGQLTEAMHIIHCERLEALGLSKDHLVIPLRFQGRSYGLINLLVPPDFRLDEPTRWALTMIGRLGGAIMGHQWALNQLREERDRLELLRRIARLANEPLPLEDLLSRIIQEMVTLLQGDRGAIALMAESGDHLRVVAEYNPIRTPSGLGVTIPIHGNPSMEWILRERRPLAIADVAGDPILGPVRPVLQAMGIRSLVIVPLLVGTRLIGTLGIDSVRRPRVFTVEEMRLAETVAAQVAGAIERARLLAETQRRASYLEALHTILQEATEAQSLRELMDRALARLCRVLQVPMGGIWLEGHAALYGLPAEFGLQIAATAREAGLELHKAMVVNDWAALPAEHPLRPMQNQMLRFGIRASMTVPAVREGQRIGGLSVATSVPREWNSDEIALMETIGRELGAVVKRLQLLQSFQTQTARLHVLYQIARALVGASDLSTLLHRALREILDHLPADAASIYLQDPEHPARLRLVAQYGFSQENVSYFKEQDVTQVERKPTITIQAFLQEKPVWVERLEDFPYHVEARAIIQRDGIRSLVATPLSFRGEKLGVLNVAWRTQRTFDAEAQNLLQGISDLLAAGIYNVQLLERTRRQAQELAALNQALSETLRLREEMIQNVSHELRTPLAVALGYLELLGDETFGPLSPEQREAITVSRGRLEELRRYVELLLTLQAVRAGEIARIPLDLRRLVEDVLSRWQTRLDPGRYQVEVQLPAQNLWLIGDPEGLVRAIGEILDNAAKFSPRGGKIEIALELEEAQVVLRVRDEGIGIPPDHLDRIGEPFYQVEGGTTRRFPGMGIGLAVARAVVEAHEGKLLVRPRSPRGTEVALVLPLAHLK